MSDNKYMKRLKLPIVAVLLTAFGAAPFAGLAADQETKLKPYEGERPEITMPRPGEVKPERQRFVKLVKEVK